MTGAIFVAGATGYTGRAVVEQLAGTREVVAHVRPESSRLQEWTERFVGLGATVDCTPWELAAMTARLTELQPATVLALLGTTKARDRKAPASERTGYEAIDYGLTHLLLEASRASGSQPRFVYLSALGADRPAGAYMQVRARIEAELAESGLPWAAARPAFISGPDRDERRAGERAGAVVFDGVMDGLAALGLRGVRDRWGTLSGAQLAAALVTLVDEGEGVVELRELRRRAGLG